MIGHRGAHDSTTTDDNLCLCWQGKRVRLCCGGGASLGAGHPPPFRVSCPPLDIRQQSEKHPGCSLSLFPKHHLDVFRCYLSTTPSRKEKMRLTLHHLWHTGLAAGHITWCAGYNWTWESWWANKQEGSYSWNNNLALRFKLRSWNRNRALHLWFWHSATWQWAKNQTKGGKALTPVTRRAETAIRHRSRSGMFPKARSN